MEDFLEGIAPLWGWNINPIAKNNKYKSFFLSWFSNWIHSSRKYSIKPFAKFKTSIYVLMEIEVNDLPPTSSNKTFFGKSHVFPITTCQSNWRAKWGVQKFSTIYTLSLLMMMGEEKERERGLPKKNI